MGKFVNPGNGSFQVALNSEIYVDKTGLIRYTNKVINTLQGYICNSRPRRFGKSITADMLTAYYSRGCDSLDMFSTLEIADSPDFDKHLNKYDVIHLDIGWFLEHADSPDNVVRFVTHCVLKELKDYYPAVVTDEITSISDALLTINTFSSNKFILIIDEWDVLVRDESSNKRVQEEYIGFLRGLFKGSGPTQYIALAYLTGILPIVRQKTQSALNNFDEFTMLEASSFSQYIGFTKKEVEALCTKYGRYFDKVRKWYDGYKLDQAHIYNPKAVVGVMLKGKYRSYWSETASYETIVPLINMNFDGLKTAIIQMLSGSKYKVDTSTFKNDLVSFKKKDDVLTYLIHLGYLAYDDSDSTAFIPNEEIRQELDNAVCSKKWSEMIELEKLSMELLNAIINHEDKQVEECIDHIHTDYTSALTYNNENSLSCVLSIALLASMEYYFKPIRELPSGRGFADLVYIPKPEYLSIYPALIVELKWDKGANTAIKQIKERKYTDALNQYTGNILLVGVNYDKISKHHQCIIEEYTKE